ERSRGHLAKRPERGRCERAVGMNTIVSFGALIVTLVGGFIIMGDERRVAPLLIALMAIATVVPLAFFGWSQPLWSAIDLPMRPLEPADDVDPIWTPPAT